MDEIDRAIMRVLQSDGRAYNAEVAARVNLSESACCRRMRSLETRGIITGYAAQIEPRAVNLGLTAFLSITLNGQAEPTLAAFEAAIAHVPEVMDCYLTTGEADYLVRVVARDVDAYEALHASVLTRLPGVARITSSISLRNPVRRSGLPI